MSISSRISGRTSVRSSPYNLHVSVCVIVPLALAFLVSAVLWDVLCFKCGSEQQSRAAILEAAKQRTRSRSAGPVDSSTIQRPLSEPLPDDEPGPAEALEYNLESAIGEGDDSASEQEAAADPLDDYDEVPDEADSADGGMKDPPSTPSSTGSLQEGDIDTADGDEDPLGESPDDYVSLYGVDGGGDGRQQASEAAGESSFEAEDEDSFDDDDEDDFLDESPEDYDSLYGAVSDADADENSTEESPAGRSEVGEAAKAAGAPGGGAKGSLDEAGDEEVNGQLDESPEDYDPLFEGQGAADKSGIQRQEGGAASTKRGSAPAGGAVDEADDVEVSGHPDESDTSEDVNSLHSDALADGVGGRDGSGETVKTKAGHGPDADQARGGRGQRLGEGAAGGGPGAVMDEADDVEAVGPEDPAAASRGAPEGAAEGTGGGTGSAAKSSDGAGAPATQYEYGFKLLPPASLKYSDVVQCSDGAEPAEEVFQPLHPGMNMLVLLGAQKGGTTWMASALMNHPAVFRAERFYGGEGRDGTKEVHYLDYWPHTNGSEAVYVDGFPREQVAAAKLNATAQLEAAGVPLKTLENAAGVRDAYEHLVHDIAFFDPTPNYLPIAHVPPRASQIMPHARFVIVLRDPVARALSAYNMDRSRFCHTDRDPPFFLPETVCRDTSFADTVANTTGVDERGDTCMFDGLDGGAPKTWQDCYKCWHMFFNSTACSRMPEPRPFDDCNPGVLNYVHVSNYAAQLAWWLAFFPPEQFLILTSAELRDPDRQINALNRVLNHAKLPNARRFTRQWLDNMTVRPFAGTYEDEDTAEGIPEAIAALRKRFQKPMEDLDHLIHRFWPHLNFTGLPDEV